MAETLARKADEPETVRMLAREILLIIAEAEIEKGRLELPPFVRIFSE